jgi:hypothetical protein
MPTPIRRVGRPGASLASASIRGGNWPFPHHHACIYTFCDRCLVSYRSICGQAGCSSYTQTGTRHHEQTSLECFNRLAVRGHCSSHCDDTYYWDYFQRVGIVKTLFVVFGQITKNKRVH